MERWIESHLLLQHLQLPRPTACHWVDGGWQGYTGVADAAPCAVLHVQALGQLPPRARAAACQLLVLLAISSPRGLAPDSSSCVIKLGHEAEWSSSFVIKLKDHQAW